MSIFIKKFMFPIFTFTSIFLLFLYCISDYSNTIDNNSYTLKAYKNTVALYDGEEIIQIYNHIVLNTLPQKDIKNFKSGITVGSIDDADRYLTDFDS